MIAAIDGISKNNVSKAHMKAANKELTRIGKTLEKMISATEELAQAKSSQQRQLQAARNCKYIVKTVGQVQALMHTFDSHLLSTRNTRNSNVITGLICTGTAIFSGLGMMYQVGLAFVGMANATMAGTLHAYTIPNLVAKQDAFAALEENLSALEKQLDDIADLSPA